MNKYIIAIIVTLMVVILAFAYPLFYRWYIITFSISNDADFLPFMMSFLLWVGLTTLVFFIWVRIIINKI